MKLAVPGFSILYRYVAREVIAPFMVGVGRLPFALVTARMLRLTEFVLKHGVTLGEVGHIIGLIMPAFLELTFPMAVLLGVLMGFGRMSSDQEMTAARACGVSLYRLAVPVMAFAFVVYALSSYFAFSLRPWANSQLREKLYALSQSRTTAGLREKVFNSSFPGLVVYIDQLNDADSAMTGVMISDARDPKQQNTIIAKRGVLLPDPQNRSITLRLFDGSIFGVEESADTSHVTSFRVYDLNISPEMAMGVTDADPEEMSYPILRESIRDARAHGKPDYLAETELASRYTVPIATLLFALLGVSLGLRPARGGHSERFGVSVALFFLYYSLMRVSETFAH